MRLNVRMLMRAAMIAAAYAVATLLTHALGLDSGVVQLRLSEALCILPLFSAAAVPGLAIGCLLANWLCGCALWDVLFGAFATLLGAYLTRRLRSRPAIALWMPVIANTAIVPWILSWVYGAQEAWWVIAGLVAAGEVLSCVFVGGIFYRALLPHAGKSFWDEK